LQVEDGVLELVARQASGALRDAISLLDQLVANPGEIVTLEQAEAMLGTAGSGAVDDLVGALVGRDLAGGLAIINRAIDEGADPRQFAHEVVERLRALLLIKTGALDWVDATDEVRAWLADLAMTIAEGELLRAIRAFNGTIAEARSGWQPQLPLELALVEALQAPAVQIVEQSSDSASPSPAPTTTAPPTYGPRKSSQSAPQPAPPQVAATQPESAPKDAAPTGTQSAPQGASKGGTLSLSRIQSEWKRFVKESRDYYHALQALLALCEPKAVEGNKLILLASRAFAKEKLEAADAFDGLLRAVEATFGQKFEVELVLPEAEGESTAPVSTTDPFIAALQQDGGQVVRVEKVEKSE
jgi:DNA polymerase-3 subunit gamma/tau